MNTFASRSAWLFGVLFLVACGRGEPTPSKTQYEEPRPKALPKPSRPPTTVLPYFNSRDFTPRWLKASDEKLRGFHRIPAFSLTNQKGETVTEKTFEGRIFVADFFFTSCPGICLNMTRNMRLLQDEFAGDDDVLFLSHSVTPETDDVEQLEAYAKQHSVTAGKWHMVTGDRKVIYKLGRHAYFVDEDQGEKADEDEFLHTENFVLIDQNRRIRGIYNGLNRASLQQLILDIRFLKRAAGLKAQL